MRSKEAMDLMMQKATQKTIEKSEAAASRNSIRFGIRAVSSYMGRRLWVCTMRALGLWVEGMLESRIASLRKASEGPRPLLCVCVCVPEHPSHDPSKNMSCAACFNPPPTLPPRRRSSEQSKVRPI